MEFPCLDGLIHANTRECSEKSARNHELKLFYKITTHFWRHNYLQAIYGNLCAAACI